MNDDDEKLDALMVQLRREFPRFRIVAKEGDRLSRSIDVALKCVTLGGQSRYLSHYHTVIGDTLYVPPGWADMPAVDKIITLRHERVHLRQRRRYTLPGMALVYLWWPLPLGEKSKPVRRVLQECLHGASDRSLAEVLAVEEPEESADKGTPQ